MAAAADAAGLTVDVARANARQLYKFVSQGAGGAARNFADEVLAALALAFLGCRLAGFRFAFSPAAEPAWKHCLR